MSENNILMGAKLNVFPLKDNGDSIFLLANVCFSVKRRDMSEDFPLLFGPISNVIGLNLTVAP